MSLVNKRKQKRVMEKSLIKHRSMGKIAPQICYSNDYCLTDTKNHKLSLNHDSHK